MTSNISGFVLRPFNTARLGTWAFFIRKDFYIANEESNTKSIKWSDTFLIDGEILFKPWRYPTLHVHNFFVTPTAQHICCDQRPATHPPAQHPPYIASHTQSLISSQWCELQRTQTHTHEVLKHVQIMGIHMWHVRGGLRIDTLRISLLPWFLPHWEVCGGLHGTRPRARNDEATLQPQTQTLHLCATSEGHLRSYALRGKTGIKNTPKGGKEEEEWFFIFIFCYNYS